MPIRIRRVLSRTDKKKFIRFPWQVYRGDKNWVPPLIIERRALLDPRQNPLFDHSDVALFLAEAENGGVLGRIAAVANRNHLAAHNDQAGFFGLFESIDDPAVARALFDAAAEFLRGKGMAVMRGPENLSINDDLGLLVSGFERPPVAMMPYNPPYYEKLVQEYGFTKSMDLYAYYGRTADGPTDRLKRGFDVATKRYGIVIRQIDMKRFDAEVESIRDLYNKAWERNWGAVAMSAREFRHVASDLRMILDPGFCLIAEHEGKPMGFFLGIPDLNQALIHLNGRLLPFGIFKFLYHKRNINCVRVLTMGVLEQYRRTGTDIALIHKAYEHGGAHGYTWGELSWILETNAPMNNALTNLGHTVYKIYRLYDCSL